MTTFKPGDKIAFHFCGVETRGVVDHAVNCSYNGTPTDDDPDHQRLFVVPTNGGLIYVLPSDNPVLLNETRNTEPKPPLASLESPESRREDHETLPVRCDEALEQQAVGGDAAEDADKI